LKGQKDALPLEANTQADMLVVLEPKLNEVEKAVVHAKRLLKEPLTSNFETIKKEIYAL